MRAAGYEPEDFEDEAFEVWPINAQAVGFFFEYCETQWRMGFGGPTGLDHSAVIADLRTLRLKREDFDRLYADVRHMERSALGEMSKKAKKK